MWNVDRNSLQKQTSDPRNTSVSGKFNPTAHIDYIIEQENEDDSTLKGISRTSQYIATHGVIE